ncbi:MAG: hypothetical protein FD174_3521 [Geobacteraceae bacterium]|nr:MAG: hypothetical protein FD174_3521 [Geobacteraceae bacterium]
MLTTTTKNSAGKLTACAILVGCAFLFQVGESLALQNDQDERGTCSFSRQLENYEDRIQFQVNLERAKKASASKYGEVFANTVTFTDGNGEGAEIDTFSFDCLSCHDGVTAPGREIRYKNMNKNQAAGVENVLGSHPIGMHYGSHAYANRGLKAINELDTSMAFVDGKVGCLTCHNPLNPNKRHLVMSNDKSKLCFSCHNK